MKLARSFRSRLVFRLGTSVADATSILSLMVLCAAMNAVLVIEASGEDEGEAIAAVEALFECEDPDPDDGSRRFRKGST